MGGSSIRPGWWTAQIRIWIQCGKLRFCVIYPMNNSFVFIRADAPVRYPRDFSGLTSGGSKGGPQGDMPPPKRWTKFFFTLSYTNHWWIIWLMKLTKTAWISTLIAKMLLLLGDKTPLSSFSLLQNYYSSHFIIKHGLSINQFFISRRMTLKFNLHSHSKWSKLTTS